MKSFRQARIGCLVIVICATAIPSPAQTDGGADHAGTVRRLSLGLPPFVKTVPTSGKVGRKVIILGNNLKNATGVSFKGVPATFTIVSNPEITAIVPAGAPTGKVEVIMRTKTLKSNVKFRAIP